MKLIYVLLLALVVVLAACSAKEIVCPDGTIVTDARDCPVPEVNVPDMPTTEPEVAPTMPEPAPEPEPVKELTKLARELQEKAANVKSYSFSYAELPENKANRKYYYKNGIVRVELHKALVREEGSYDVVYLDPARKRAIAYCELGNQVVCRDQQKQDVEYADYALDELPHEIMANLVSAEDAGSLTFNEHVAALFTYEEDGKYVRLTVHKFFGIPMRKEIFESSDYQGEETGAVFRDMAFNSVTDSQVTPPDGW